MDKNPHAIVEITAPGAAATRWDSWEHPRLFKRVTVELTTNQASEAVWEFFDPTFAVVNRYTPAIMAGLEYRLQSGSSNAGNSPTKVGTLNTLADKLLVLRFWLGFGSGLELGPAVFKGLLARVERGDSQTAFRAYDMGFKMRLVKKSEHHSKLSDVGIIEKLAKRNGLQFQGPDPGTLPPKGGTPNAGKHDAMMQDQKTDWDMAMERAREAGLVLFVRDDTLFAKPPATPGTALVTLTNRKDMQILHNFDLTFKVPENQAGRPGQVKVHTRGRGGHRRTGATPAGRGHQALSLKSDIPQHGQSAATGRAKARKDLEREHAFVLSVRALPEFGVPPLGGSSKIPPKGGTPNPDVRDTIDVEGIGALYSGLYLADKVSHEFSDRGFFTTYDLYRDVKE
jgi:phage protein D